jgi:hypothetical protein
MLSEQKKSQFVVSHSSVLVNVDDRVYTDSDTTSDFRICVLNSSFSSSSIRGKVRAQALLWHTVRYIGRQQTRKKHGNATKLLAWMLPARNTRTSNNPLHHTMCKARYVVRYKKVDCTRRSLEIIPFPSKLASWRFGKQTQFSSVQTNAFPSKPPKKCAVPTSRVSSPS